MLSFGAKFALCGDMKERFVGLISRAPLCDTTFLSVCFALCMIVTDKNTRIKLEQFKFTASHFTRVHMMLLDCEVE